MLERIRKISVEKRIIYTLLFTILFLLVALLIKIWQTQKSYDKNKYAGY
jgi:CHASE3 domain sensor protein